MIMLRPLLAAAFLLAVSAIGAASSAAAQTLCPECLAIRLGPPQIVRGPSGASGMESDAPFVVIKKSDGGFRGFTSNARTFAIEGSSPIDMGGAKRVVMQPGRKGTLSDCGNWLTGVLPVDNKLVGLVHGESDCDYEKGRTHKAMAIATSADEGLNWQFLGAIITNTDKPTPGKMTGEGDCTLADGGDGYLYVYCLRPSDWKITVARAARGNIAPGQWMKWDGQKNGQAWRIPALDRAGAPLAGFPGHSTAFYAPRKLMLLLAVSKSLTLSFAADKVNFTRVPAPLILYDSDEWNRPSPDALYAYPSLVGESGTNSIGERGWLTYAYVPPNEDFTQRYLIVHEIAIVPHATPPRRTEATAKAEAPQGNPQVRVALARYKAADGRRWTSVAPAIEKGPRTFTLEKTLGDVMTAAPNAPSERIEECVPAAGGALEYRLSAGACDTGFRRTRTAGFVYREEQPGTAPLYMCVARDGKRFAATEETCEGLGTREKRLGWLLK